MKDLRFLLQIIIFSIGCKLLAQGPGCPNVNAGLDVNVDCSSSCVNLTATYIETGETDSYSVSSIPYNPPFPYTGLSNPVSVDIDDVWSNVINLPFDFCFFGDIYSQIQVGSNGVIRFDIDPLDVGPVSNPWQFAENIPNNTNEALAECNVFGVGHDIDPSVTDTTTPDLAWDVTGVSPCRTFVMSYGDVAQFQCNDLISTSMIVFYETTNVIEVYVRNKPICDSWNRGNAIIGIQNNEGTIAYVAPGRNTSDSPWTTTNEAWRFTPNGATNYQFSWYDDDGNDLGNSNTITVCPASDTVYTAEVVYTNCNGDVSPVTDDLLVSTSLPYSVDIGPDQDLCEDDSDVILNADIGSATAGYQWALNGTNMAGETNSSITVTSPNSGTYSVTVLDQGCVVTDVVTITYHEIPIVNSVSDYQLCDDAVLDGFTQFDLSTKDVEVLGGQTGFTVTYHDDPSEAESGSDSLPNLYNNTANPQPIYVRVENNNYPDCYVTLSFNLILGANVMANQPQDIEVCDDDSNDGIESFNLLSQTSIILGSQTGFTVTYHDSQSNANLNNMPLSSPYDSSGQTIYVRIEDDSDTRCFTILTFELVVNAKPEANPVSNIALCDTDISGEGFEIFDLTIREPEIIGGQQGMTVTFFEDFDSAEAGTGAITNPAAYESASNETIYARIENNNDPNCYNIIGFELLLNALPLDLTLSTTLAFSGQNAIEATVAGTGSYEFSLDGEPWVFDVDNMNSYTFFNLSAGEHTVTVRDVNGCGEISRAVLLIGYPKFFTPNGDGNNDTWNVIGLESQLDAKILLFDRYGKLLKQLAPNGKGWDGTYNGYPLPADDYWFTVDYIEPSDGSKKQFSAHFSLKR